MHENILDLDKTDEILRDKQLQISNLIWKSVTNERNHRLALESTSLIIQSLKEEIDQAIESVHWEGVVEYCNLSIPFFKIWKPMYMTIGNGEISLQDISALPPQYGNLIATIMIGKIHVIALINSSSFPWNSSFSRRDKRFLLFVCKLSTQEISRREIGIFLRRL